MAADTIRSLFVLWSAWSGEQGLVIGMLEDEPSISESTSLSRLNYPKC